MTIPYKLNLSAIVGCALLLMGSVAKAQTQAQAKKPNILVIMGDDIGWYNASIYNRGDMGYQTPNIDRV